VCPHGVLQMGFVTYEKKLRALAGKKNICELALRKRCLRDFSVPFLSVLVRLNAVFLERQNVKYDRDITPRLQLFHGTNSHEVTQVVHRNGDEQRERERKIHSSTSQNFSVKLLIMSSIYVLESKIFSPDENLRSFNLDQKNPTLFQTYFPEFQVD